METFEYRRQVQGLLMLPTDKRKDALEKLLELLKCKHESDGVCYTSMPPKYKCKKCGEYYPCS